MVSNSGSSSRYANLLADFYLTQHIVDQSCVTDTSSTLIDHIFIVIVGCLFSRATNFARRAKALFRGNDFRGLTFSARATTYKYDVSVSTCCQVLYTYP